MKKIKNITKVLDGQKEVALRVAYNDDTVETFRVLEGQTADEVLGLNVRMGNINLKGYNTRKRVLVEQIGHDANTASTEEAIRIAKRTQEAMEAARKLNDQYAGVANFQVNTKAFEQPTAGRNETVVVEENNNNVSRRGFILGAGTVILLGTLVWGGIKLSKTENCAPKVAALITRLTNGDDETTLKTKTVEGEEVVLVENSRLSEKEVKALAKVACDSKYVAKANYTQADLENVICLVNGLDMINTDCRVTDPYRVEQFFNDMTNQAIEHYFDTNGAEIKCYDYSKLYAEGSIECEALKNIEKGFAEVNSNESAQEYFAKCYRVAQGLEVDGINVLEDTNEQFEGSFYYAVADRAMLYNMKQGESLKIRSGLIWYDLGDNLKDVLCDTEAFYNPIDETTNGIMEGLRLDWIHNELARCSKVKSKKNN